MWRWGILWLGLALGFGPALGLNIGAARAAAKPAHAPAKLVLPRPDPPGHWRHMTQNPATTTSKCVGQVTNPMCAVDTLLACLTRQDDNLCRIALGLDKLPGMISKEPYFRGSWEKYRVLWSGRKPTGHLTPRQKTFYRSWFPNPEGILHPWPPGDVKIVILRVGCTGNSCLVLPRSMWEPFTYLVHPIPSGWKVVDWDEKCNWEDRYTSRCG